MIDRRTLMTASLAVGAVALAPARVAAQGQRTAPWAPARRMSKADFARYIDHFNKAEMEALIPYYSPDVQLYLTGNEPVVGPQAIVDRYRKSFEFLTESLRVDTLIMDDSGMAVEFYTRFTANRDHPTFSAMPLKQGDVYVMQNFVIYDFDDQGRFSRIRVARWRNDPSGVKSRA